MADASAEPGARLSGRRLAAAFVALTVALVAVSVWAGFLIHDGDEKTVREAEVERAQRVAARNAVNFMSMSYRSFDRDYARFMADMDEKMKREAAQGSAQAKQAVLRNQLVSTADLRWVGTTSITKRSATVVVTVDRTAQSVQVKAPVSSFGRFQVELTKRHGRWLVSDMKPVH